MLNWGSQKIKLVVVKAAAADLTIYPEKFKTFTPKIAETKILDELDTAGELAYEQIGLRMSFEIFYDKIHGDELVKFSRLVHQATLAGEAGWDTIKLYPSYTENPDFYIDVIPEWDDVDLETFYFLLHSEFTLRFVARTFVDFLPLKLAHFDIIKRNVWTINEGGKPVVFPASLNSADYYLDVRDTGSEWVGVESFRVGGFTPRAPVNGRVARYVAIDPSVNAATTQIRTGRVTINAASTRINYPAGYSGSVAFKPRVRAEDGAAITVTAWDATGFNAEGGNPSACRYFVIGIASLTLGQSQIRGITGSVTDSWSTIAFAALPGSDYFYDILSRDGYELEFRNESVDGIEIKAADGATNIDGYLVHQQV